MNKNIVKIAVIKFIQLFIYTHIYTYILDSKFCFGIRVTYIRIS